MILIGIHVSCKKSSPLCACSPPESTYLSTVIKDANNKDLLNTVNMGSFAKDKIQLFSIDVNGMTKSISFEIRAPFSNGGSPFIYNQLFSVEIAALAKSVDHNFS